jgi:hypothetical protein
VVRCALSSEAIAVHESNRESTDRVVAAVISLAAVATFHTQYLLRGLDDNRLTSWQWVFAGADVARVSAALVVGVALAYALTKVSASALRPSATLFFFSFAAAALFWKEPEVIVDAARYFTQAKHLELYGAGYFLGAWGREVSAWTDLPLVPFLYGVIFSALGEARVPIQTFTTLLFSGTVVLTYLIGKTLWDATVGACAGALLLAMPYLFTQVPLMLVDVPAMFFLTAAVFTTIKALGRGGALWVALSSVAVALAFLSKYSTWPSLTVVLIIFLVRLREEPGRALRRGAALLLVLAALAGVVALLKHDVISEQIGLLRSYQAPGLGRWRESFVSTFFFQIHPLVTVAAACSVFVALKKRDLRYAIIGWLPFLVVAARIERIRYILVVFPMLALMASYGLKELRSAEARRFAVSCAVASSLAVALFAYLPYLSRMSAVNLKDAGEYLNAVEGEAVEVFTLPQAGSVVNPAVSVPLLDLFTNKRIVHHSLPAQLPPRKEIETSPLRFTWEYETPGYYVPGAVDPGGKTAVVVILSDAHQPLTEQIERRIDGHRLSREFLTSDDRFQYRTLVRVYLPGESPPATEAN